MSLWARCKALPLNYADEASFKAKPLATVMLDRNKAPVDIVAHKENWFRHRKSFKKSITNHFEQPYREDKGFLKCLFELRKILYQHEDEDEEDLDSFLSGDLDKNDSKVTEDADPMKEGLFRKCMKEIDDYLDDTKGCSEMEWIDSNARA